MLHPLNVRSCFLFPSIFKYGICIFLQLSFPVFEVVGMRFRLFREYCDCFVALQRRQGYLCFECRTVISTLPYCDLILLLAFSGGKTITYSPVQRFEARAGYMQQWLAGRLLSRSPCSVECLSNMERQAYWDAIL